MNNSNNIKNTWKGIKSIISLKDNKKSHPNSILFKNKLLSKPKEVANTFNDYFSSIATELQSKIHNNNKNFKDFLGTPNPHSFFINPTNFLEVSNEIDDLQSKKANGPTSIPSNILKLIKPSVAQPLVEIINLSFSTGKYICQIWFVF